MIGFLACLACFIMGFCMAAVFNGSSYDRGFDDGYSSRITDELYEEHEEGDDL